MHWTSAQPGGFDAERELVLIDQTPGEIAFVSAADSDLACASAAWGASFGKRLRIAHASGLRQPVAADDYVGKVARHARIVVARLLGGQAYFTHFLQGLADLRDLKENGPAPRLLLLSGADTFDEELAALSDFPREICEQVFRYFKEGGLPNYRLAGEAITLLLENRAKELPPALPMPECDVYRQSPARAGAPVAWITFYRAWLQADDLEVVDSLVEALESRGFAVTAWYAYSLRSAPAHAMLEERLAAEPPDLVLTTQSFPIASDTENRVSLFEKLGCPVLQAIVGTSSREVWLRNPAGLSPSETAINVALPEIDGRVLAGIVGFKEEAEPVVESEFTLKRLRPDPEQIAHVADLAARWAKLRRIPNGQKRIAVILSNYPNRDGGIGNGVGLDTPASAVALLHALAAAGYETGPLPSGGEALMRQLQETVTNDPRHSYGKPTPQTLPLPDLDRFLQTLPPSRREELGKHWPDALPDALPVAGKQFGNVFLGIQPPRGFSLQTQAVYHSPDLPPPPAYLAFYLWVRETFRADAVVHLGKHGNLEWLPGRSVALGSDDYPHFCLGPLPHLYPFIVNNPGEGTQAKRRTAAVIVDHLTPPLTRSGLYDDLDRVERLLEEHTHCVALYPSRAAELERRIEEALAAATWKDELPAAPSRLEALGNYLCEIKESQIRSGLHIFGRAPEGEHRTDFLLSLLRHESGERPGLLDTLHGTPVDLPALTPSQRDRLEAEAKAWIEQTLSDEEPPRQSPPLRELRRFTRQVLVPRLAACDGELANLLTGLSGGFVPPGPAGAPTRGRIDVLPTGRNFFAVDPRLLPTPTAWACGKAMADRLLERHRQETGDYPRRIALVVWGTSNMRTGGDDIAQALWLWGCEPVREAASGRVVDFRILPATLLGRPRVDLILRVSGLFRDTFGDLVRLLATVPKRLAELDEPPALNPIREASLRLRAEAAAQGETSETATARSVLRVFSSGPGSYGAGLLPLIDGRNWTSADDLAAVFCKWGGHALASDGSSTEEIPLLRSHLREVEVVHQNQDNREHDILDSDDYFQFQGGLHATVTALRGTAPATYHGDSSRPESPKVRTLGEELVRVLRSRVLNPKWIAAMRRHGYKGAFEMAATVDYAFGYGATTGLVASHHYDEIARRLLLDPEQKAFFLRHNPAALQESAQRMIEAHERNLWRDADPATLAQLEQTLLELEGDLE